MCFSACAFFDLCMLSGELSAFKEASDLIWLLESRWIQIFLPSSSLKAIIPSSSRLLSFGQSAWKPHSFSCLQAMNLESCLWTPLFQLPQLGSPKLCLGKPILKTLPLHSSGLLNSSFHVHPCFPAEHRYHVLNSKSCLCVFFWFCAWQPFGW